MNIKDEDRVLFWIWGKINPSYGRYLRKDKLLSYLDSNPDICRAFGLVRSQYGRVIMSMITEKPDFVTFDEFDVGFR